MAGHFFRGKSHLWNRRWKTSFLGYESYGELGNGPPAVLLATPTPIGPSTKWTAIAAGDDHTCGVDDGTLFCWGSDSYGQIGNGSTTGDITSPTSLGASADWGFLGLGAEVSCGINQGSLFCFGR